MTRDLYYHVSGYAKAADFLITAGVFRLNNHTLFFYKNVVFFPAQAQYSFFFSADFRLKYS